MQASVPNVGHASLAIISLQVAAPCSRPSRRCLKAGALRSSAIDQTSLSKNLGGGEGGGFGERKYVSLFKCHFWPFKRIQKIYLNIFATNILLKGIVILHIIDLRNEFNKFMFWKNKKIVQALLWSVGKEDGFNFFLAKKYFLGLTTCHYHWE